MRQKHLDETYKTPTRTDWSNVVYEIYRMYRKTSYDHYNVTLHHCHKTPPTKSWLCHCFIDLGTAVFNSKESLCYLLTGSYKQSHTHTTILLCFPHFLHTYTHFALYSNKSCRRSLSYSIYLHKALTITNWYIYS